MQKSKNELSDYVPLQTFVGKHCAGTSRMKWLNFPKLYKNILRQ